MDLGAEKVARGGGGGKGKQPVSAHKQVMDKAHVERETLETPTQKPVGLAQVFFLESGFCLWARSHRLQSALVPLKGAGTGQRGVLSQGSLLGKQRGGGQGPGLSGSLRITSTGSHLLDELTVPHFAPNVSV